MGENEKVPGDIARLSYSQPQGAGGEARQVSQNGETLTAADGRLMADPQNSLRQGPRGAALLEDAHFREKPFRFDHAGNRERVVHARGADQFIEEFRKFRFWAGEAAVDLGGKA